jgi:hypothetical protein
VTPTWRRIALAASLALAALDAHGQTLPPAYYLPVGDPPPRGFYPPPGWRPEPWYAKRDLPRPFEVLFVGDAPDRRFTISFPGGGKPFAYCENRCGVWLYPGHYVVSVRSSASSVAGDREIHLRRASTVRIEPRQTPHASALWPVGLALVAGGLLITGAAISQSSDESDPDAQALAPLWALLGLATVVTGASLAAAGSIRAPSTAPDVDVDAN